MGKTVLLVEDSPTDVHVIREMLTTAGYDVVTVESAEEALESCKSARPDAVLMDIILPNMSGFEATRKLKKGDQTKDIPVIMISTKNQDTDRVWAFRQGALGYLQKPIDKKHLLDTLTECTS